METQVQAIEPDPIPQLDCGHAESPHSPITRGYACMADGRRICYSCAEVDELNSLVQGTTHTGYLHENADGSHSLTSWPGWELARVTRLHTFKAWGFGGWHTRTSFTAIDRWGQHWYGTSPGAGMYARMRKAKGQPAEAAARIAAGTVAPDSRPGVR